MKSASDAEEPAVGAHGRGRRDAEDPFVAVADPERLPPLERLALGQDSRHEAREAPGVSESKLSKRSPRASRDSARISRPASFSSTTVPCGSIERRPVGRLRASVRAAVSRSSARSFSRRARRSSSRSFSRERGDRGLEARDEELALVADGARPARSDAGRAEHPVERREERAQIQAREHDERRARDRYEDRHERREAPQARAGARIERQQVHAFSGGEPPEQEGRLKPPFEGGASCGRASTGQNRRSVEAVPRALHAMTSRVVDPDEHDVRLEKRSLDGLAR